MTMHAAVTAAPRRAARANVVNSSDYKAARDSVAIGHPSATPGSQAGPGRALERRSVRRAAVAGHTPSQRQVRGHVLSPAYANRT